MEYLRYLSGDDSVAEIRETETEGFDHTQTLAAGKWYVLVKSPNDWNRMTVYVHVEVN